MKHVGAVDGLRAWMAWWVVCQHLLQISGISTVYDNPVTRLLTMGGLGVVVFIIISGFVIANLLLMKKEPFAPYIARRFFRIYPLYAIAIVVAALLQQQYFQNVSLAPWALEGNSERVLDEWKHMPWHLGLHSLLVHGVVPNTVLSSASSAILAPAWSLSLEWQYYLVAPLLTACLVSKRTLLHVVAGALCTICLVSVYILPVQQYWTFPAFLPLLIGFFLFGSITRLFFSETDRRRLIFPAIIALINFALYARTYTGGHFLVAAVPVAIWGAAVFSFTYSGSRKSVSAVAAFIKKFLDTKFAVNLGLWSYSTYLLHVPVFVVSLSLLRISGIAISPYSYFITMLISCIALVPLSWFSYRFIEKPAMRMGARWISRVWNNPATENQKAVL
ncbi:MAG: acyltransferase [Brevundimonas sp.]|uniref:acyltransferase family protein n=1 Tax=Brevundimonas sp. TaxID=1871086 RepID=UPI002735F048|nr:acyltransferase [Brevundimonas sp.]MDP3405216.1 acyltransferase [Brevundimonas sp.]